MPIFEIRMPDGRVFEAKADSYEHVLAALKPAPDLPPMTPPPDAVVHGGDGVSTAYGAAGKPNVSMRRSVSDLGDQQSWRRSNIEQEALQARQRGVFGPAMRGIMPAYQGLTMGWGDEAVSALAGATDAMRGKSYSDRYVLSQEIQRQDLARERADNPGRAFGSELAGSIATLAAVPSMGVKTVAGAAGEGLGVGALMGGAQGAGTAQDFDPNASRLERGLYGAIGGGLGGAAGGAAGQVLAPLIQSAGAKLSRRAAKFAGPAADQAAARILAVAEKMGITAPAAQAEMKRLGQEGMVADVLGTGGQRLARTAANADDAAQQMIEEALMRRAAGAPERVANDVAAAGGVKAGDTIEGLQEGIRAAEQPGISALYKKARDAGADLPDAPFRNLMQSPLVKRAYDKAYQETQDRVIAFGAGENSSLAVWDATKKNLDAIAQGARQTGDRATAALAEKLAKDVRATVDLFTPAYSPARGASQKMFGKLNDIEAGAAAAKTPNAGTIGALGKTANPQEVAKGYAAQMVDMVLAKRGTPGLVDSLLGSPNQVSAMMAALGKNGAKVAERADIERQFARTQRGATGNSSTARQLADLGIIPAAAGIGYLGGYDPLQAGGVASLLVAGRRGVNKLIDARRAKIESEVAREVAKLLTLQRFPKPPARAVQGAEKRIADLLARVVSVTSIPAGVAMGAVATPTH